MQFNFLPGYRLGSINATSLPSPSTLKTTRFNFQNSEKSTFNKAVPKVQKYLAKEDLKQTDQSYFSSSRILLGDGSYNFFNSVALIITL